MVSAGAALARLCDPRAEVSAHYLIAGDGTVWQLVAEHLRAWHAGAGEWGGSDDINSRSIGIELDNRGDHPFAAPQMRALEILLAGILSRWDIGPEAVIGHSDMAPGRKGDPGARFDWARLARRGLALWPVACAPMAPQAEVFRALAQGAGYTAPASDAELLRVVRLRFRPWGRGGLNSADMAVLAGLPANIGVI